MSEDINIDVRMGNYNNHQIESGRTLKLIGYWKQ